MGEREALPARDAVNLARISPFRIGALEVTPATRQLKRGERGESLEPRVMQVLVALWRAEGAIVTRDDLIAVCWDGRVVGDNAIHRTISRLRDVATAIGEGCFRIETVSKVGYRLVAAAESPADLYAPESRARRRNHDRTYIAVAAGLATAAVVLAIWVGRPASTAARIVIIAAPGAGSTELANGLAVDLAHLANTHGNALVFAAGPEIAGQDYELKVAERGSRGETQADVSLFKTGSHDLVWSAAFTGRNTTTVRQRIANRVSNAVECALHANGDTARRSGDRLRVLFSACERLDENRDDTTAALWRRAVAGNPGNAFALATLSYVEADFSVFLLPETKAAAWRTAARRHLRKARAASTHLGLSYAAEAILLPAPRYAERLAIVEHGLALDPDCAVLHGLRSEYLHNVGRMDDALDSARAAVALAPDSAFVRENLISALAYGGFARAAESELETAERIWPDAHALKEVRFRFDYRFGDAAGLIRDIDEGAALPNSPMLIESGPERAFLLARAQPTPQNIDNAVALALKYARPPYQSLQSLVALGHKDQAYALMESPRMAAAIGKSTEILFRANMRPFVLDRRFMAFADRLGLVRYWLTSNAWPDFCEDKDVAYNCKAEARRLHLKPA